MFVISTLEPNYKKKKHEVHRCKLQAAGNEPAASTSCYRLELITGANSLICSEKPSERNQFSTFLCCLPPLVCMKLYKQSVYLPQLLGT